MACVGVGRGRLDGAPGKGASVGPGSADGALGKGVSVGPESANGACVDRDLNSLKLNFTFWYTPARSMAALAVKLTCILAQEEILRDGHVSRPRLDDRQ
jgi:hypothetical protein